MVESTRGHIETAGAGARERGAPPHDAHAPREHVHLTPDEAAAMDLRPGEVAEEEQLEDEVPQQVAIGKRFANWKTLLSFALAVAVLAFVVSKAHISWATTSHTLGRTNLWLFGLAFVVYYASFPIRTHRWRRLMHNANHGPVQQRIDRFPLWDLTQILYLSWFANVIVPAKLGDVYRAYLARRWMGVSLSRTVGSLLAERILDLLVLFPLLLAAAFLTFQSRIFSANNVQIRYALVAGLALAVIAALILVVIWRAGESVLRVLPHRVHDVYLHFRHGAIGAFGNETPSLVGQTVVVWLLEGGRLACVLWALGLLRPGEIGPAAAIFLALGSSVLTAVPFTPGGLGLVDGFIIAVLVVLGVHVGNLSGASIAAAVALLDRLISYFSIAIIGFLLYVFGDKARGTPPQFESSGALAAR